MYLNQHNPHQNYIYYRKYRNKGRNSNLDMNEDVDKNLITTKTDFFGFTYISCISHLFSNFSNIDKKFIFM